MSNPDDEKIYYISPTGQASSNAHDGIEACLTDEAAQSSDSNPTNGNCGQDADNVSESK